LYRNHCEKFSHFGLMDMPNFDFSQDYILENENVKLRPLALSDYDFLVGFAIQEPETWTYSFVQPIGEEGMKNYIESAISARSTLMEYPFIVFDKLQQQYAGSTRFYDIQLNNKTLQLGYTWYGKAFRGTGLNKHCKLLLLQFAFEQMGMERVEFRADHQNERSITAMKSIGCVEEGILRSHGIKSDGKRRSSMVLSILRQEWETSVKQRLQEKLQIH